jgi:uncharacterized protein YbjQ (UPF0145 family)
MSFWKQRSEEHKRQEKERIESLKMLQVGQIPLKAQRRIMLHNQNSDSFFSSNLTHNEHLLVRESGYQPIGLVTGTSFYKVSHKDHFRKSLDSNRRLLPDDLKDIKNFRNPLGCDCRICKGFIGEIALLSQIHLEARESAIKRLQQEAALLGAHGIIGVELSSNEYDWSSGVVEFTAIGTAIRISNRSLETKPFTSNLNGQDFWKLCQAGYYPRGLVIGVCSYYSQPRIAYYNESEEHTEAMQLAQHIARRRLDQEIDKQNADGAIGVGTGIYIQKIEYEENEEEMCDLLIHCLAVGTAIIRSDQNIRSPNHSTLVVHNLAANRLERWNYSKLI